MKTQNYIFAAAFAVLAAAAQAQTTATTVPVGFATTTLLAGSPETPSTKMISVPLYNAAEISGTVTAIGDPNQLTISSGAVTSTTAAPRLVKVMSGNSVGRFFLINPVSASSTFTVDLSSTPTFSPATLVGNVSVGDSIQIIPANTLGTLFGTNTATLPTNWVAGANAGAADQVWILSNSTTWFTCFNNGTNWKRTGSLSNLNDTVIYPDDGLILLHTANNLVSLTFLGTVPSTNEKTDFSSTGSTAMANRFPVDMTLVSMGLQSTPGWVTGPNAGVADTIWAWNPAKVGGAGWDTFFHNGSIWKKTGNLANQDGFVISAGTGFIVIRTGSPAPGAVTLAQTLPYVITP